MRIPLTFADSTYTLRNSPTAAKSRTTSCICLGRNPQKIKGADKFYVTVICTRNPRNSCKWNPLTFWNMFKYLSLESRNIQAQNCAPIQCTVWPRNDVTECNKKCLPACSCGRRSASIVNHCRSCS